MIAALLPNDIRQQRLRTAVRDPRALVLCESWSSLTWECERAAPQLVVFDLYADGAPDFERVRQLRARAPRAALVAYVDGGRARLRDAFDAGRCGLEALVVMDEDDGIAALTALIERALARSVASLVRPRVAHYRSAVRDAVLIAITRAHERLTPDGLARRIAVSRRLLARRLAEASLPAPHQLLTWGRLVVAAHLLEQGSRSAEGVASALDFPSAGAFRNVCRRYLDVTPHQIKPMGGAAWVVDRMLEPRAVDAADLADDADDADVADVADVAGVDDNAPPDERPDGAIDDGGTEIDVAAD